MLPATMERVPAHTRKHINARIERETIANIAATLRADRIDERLHELDCEWDTERTLQTNFAIVSLLGLGLSFFNRRWMLLNVVASGFMLQHSLQGWCPPLALFRRLGVRDPGEIERERMALLALRDRGNRAVRPSEPGTDVPIEGTTA